jgi:hypothetical protein
MRGRLIGDEDGLPMLAMFSTCRDSIRTIPALQHDADKPEDLDSDMEDHAADDTRYACMSRPWIRKPPAVDKPTNISGYKSVSGASSGSAWKAQ